MTGALFQAGLVGDLSHFLCKQRPSLRPPRKSNLALDKEDGRTDGIIRMQAGWAGKRRGTCTNSQCRFSLTNADSGADFDQIRSDFEGTFSMIWGIGIFVGEETPLESAYVG